MPGIRLAALVRKLRRDGTPELGGSSDADLLARFAANRDEAAFELLVWRHGAMVLAACRRVLGHTEDAEDAFQAAFLVLARKAGSVRRGVAVPAWLHRVAVRIAGKLARKRRPTALLEVEPAARPAPDPAERVELRGVLDAEIDRLSEPCRRAFVLCYLEGLSNADAARLIGCPVGTIESRLTAARRKLRDRLARRKVELPAGILALLGVQSGLAKETVARLSRAGVLVAERGVSAALGVVREPAVKLAQGVLVMTKLRTWAGATLGVALIGLAAGVGWAHLPADPPPVVLPEVAATEPEVAPQPKPKDGKGEAWPLARTTDGRGTLLRIGPDGTTILSHSGSVIYGTSLVTGKNTYLASSDQTIHSVAVSPDGRQVVTAEGVNGVKVRDAKTRQVIEGLWPTGDLPATAVGFSADGSKFVVICSRSSSGFGGGRGAAIAAPKNVPPEVQAKIKAARAKATLPVRISVWDTATRKELRNTAEELTGNNVADGTFTLAGHGRFIIKAELVSKPDEAGEDKFASRRFTITDPFANKTKAAVDVTEWNVGMFGPDALSPDGETLALLDSAGGRNVVRFVDTATGRDRFRPPAFRRPLKAVAFSQDGRLVAASTGIMQNSPEIAAPSEVVIWEVATGKELARLVDQDRIRDHYALAFSPNGSFLVSQSLTSRGQGGAFGQGELRIWGSPPAPAPEPEPVKPKAKAPADVPDRFASLFASLAADGATDVKRVESLFLAALGRLPSDVEARTLASQLTKRNDKAEAMKDLLGTLVETAEFKAHAEALGRLAK